MLQTFDMAALIPGMYVIKVTKQKDKLTINSSGQVKSTKHIADMIHQGILEVQVDLSKSTHMNETPPNKIGNEYLNASGLTYNQQLELALELHAQAKAIQDRLLKRTNKGKLSSIDEVATIMDKLVTEVFECDDALSIVTLLKEDDHYFMEHGINCAILMVIFGQALNIEKAQLYQLGIGALLMDIGMMKLPLVLTQKADSLSSAETTKMQCHVDATLKLIEPIGPIDDISLQVIQQHHERIDGSGYPEGLKGEQISLYGKMAAIVDTYDSLTSERPFRQALSPLNALTKMVNEELGLDKTLLDVFVKCLGDYPIGSIVKLKSSKIAMVIRSNKAQPLLPIVMVFYNVKTQDDTVARLDLSQEDDEILSVISLNEVNMGIPQLLTKTLSQT